MSTKVQGTEGITFPDGSVQSSAAYSKAQDDALFAKLSQFTGANAAYGYFRIPGGLLICWGTSNPDASGNAGVTWSRPFSAAPYAVICRAQVAAGAALPAANELWVATANSINSANCQMSARYFSTATGVVPAVWPINYVAIGWDTP